MKLRMSLLVLFGIICGVATYAITVGEEPPLSYINNLKTCTKYNYSTESEYGNKMTYTIKGLLPNGRCEVNISSYIDYTNNKEAYNAAISLMSAFANAAGAPENKIQKGLPSAQDLTDESRDDMVCKFSKSEREALYNAYLKHDNKNPKPNVKDGNMEISFSTSKMSSYDKLMMKYGFSSAGPCVTLDQEGEYKNWEKYACEYSDTTCYVDIHKDGTRYVNCNPTKDKLNTQLINTVVNHAKSGKCIKL